MRRRLLIAVLLLLLVPAALLSWLMLTEGGLRWVYRQAEFYLPGIITTNTIAGSLVGPITLQGVEYEQDGVVVRAGQVVFDWQPAALLTASIDINRVHIESLEIVLPVAEHTGPAEARVISLPEISLPWRMLLSDVRIDGFSVSQPDQGFRLEQIRLNATTLFSRVDINELAISADTFSVRIQGNLRPTRDYRHDLQIDWQAELPSSEVLNGQGQLAGNLLSTRLKQQLRGPLQLRVDAELKDVLKQLNWRADVDATAFDVAKLYTGLPALSGAIKLEANGDLNTAAVSGRLKGQYPELGALDADFDIQRLGDNTIQIDRFELRVPGIETFVDASGTWLPAGNGGDIKLALNWQNLRWPVQDPAWFSSASGSGSIEGNIDRYRIQLTSESPWPQLAPSSWQASAEGNADGMTIQSLRVDAMGGEAVATGQLDWSPVLKWKATVNAADIDPYSRLPEWPGQLDAKLTTNGRVEKGELVADVDITRLSGKLRGYPVTLVSRLGWRHDGLDIARLEFHSGDSRVSASGRVADVLKLDWAVAATDLAELYPGASGQLQANGQLSGEPRTPMIEASFNGKAVGLPGYVIGTIDGDVAVDLSRWQRIDIRLTALALDLRGQRIESLDINADTRLLKAQAVLKEATANMELVGKVNDQGWQGRVERADILSRRFGDWRLQAPASLRIDELALAAETLCWRNSEQASVCVSLQREAGLWQSRVAMSQVPLLVFGPWLPPDLKLEGVANASADLRLQTPDLLTAQADIKLPAGSVSYPLLEGERDHWQYQGGTVAIRLDQRGLKIDTAFAMTEGERFTGRLDLPGLNLFALDQDNQSLNADAKLDIHDLGLIEAIVPEVQDLRGEVELSLHAAGTLAQPRLGGRAHLLNGALRIPRLGLSVEGLSLKGHSLKNPGDGVEKLEFSLDARSGDGNLAIRGQTTLDSSAGWPTQISIRGDQFQVSSIPEARVVVSPDLQVNLHHRDVRVTGDVLIPYAKLQPKDITMAARVSNDAVIVGGEQPPEETWSVHTRIRLTLGDRVNFFGYGFEGRFGGSLLLEDEPGQLTRATGEINIPEGRYRAYGQRLDVEYGRLLFAGGPLTNPGLDLRAVRKVGNVTAGIKVRGSLDQPRLELFSSPAMGQTDALAYLMLGGPIENASGEEGAMMAKAALALGLSGGDSIARSLGDRFGLDEMRVETSDEGDQASLVVGRYLSPQLYVSYGVGLIESINTLALRYQISEKWQIKAESGSYQGADILYTIER